MTPVSAPRVCAARVESVADLTPTVRETCWRLEDPPSLAFEPGQSIELDFTRPGGEREARGFSIASDPGEPLLRIATKLVEGGLASGFFRGLAKGATVRFRAPYGSFVLSPERERPALFVATGTGVAPIRAMLRAALLARRDRRPMTLLFGVRHEADLFWQDEFLALAADHPNFRFVPTLSRPGEAWTGARGRVTDHLERQASSPAEIEAYVCGGAAMVLEVERRLVDRGVAPARLHRERWF